MSPFESALAYEEQNRTLATLGLARELFGRMICALTWRHVQELQLAGNAFITGTEPGRADVFLFLWRLDACFTRPDGTMPNWPAPAARPSYYSRTKARLTCWCLAKTLSPNKAEPAIREWVRIAFQDKPAPRSDENAVIASPLLPHLNWCEFLAGFFAEKNVIGAAFLDLPIAYTFQVYRTHLISQGDNLRFLPPSTALYRAESA